MLDFFIIILLLLLILLGALNLYLSKKNSPKHEYEEVLEDKANDEVCIRFGVVLKLCRMRCRHYDHRGIEWGWYR